MNRQHSQWRTSSYSGGSGGSCVEVADAPQASAVRDTQNRHLGALLFDSAEWRAFLTAAKHDAL
ncbi:DUF397 domain-containing protein [Actinorugispora endophytica]|uniref:Uncharacterized protein DUF397 n=1 Tax=Actinorugispora endophytica TaxID=1605990 RepID=A0A4R6V808_9ACTN|nr:DUF397 domain-containing protein [Actinorugispora endophytica]TDQ55402.1 uncharacterized protein DUF397 [Actinorugispora endophytica]